MKGFVSRRLIYCLLISVQYFSPSFAIGQEGISNHYGHFVV